MVLPRRGRVPMKAFRWTYIVAAMAAVCLGAQAASAQVSVRSGAGLMELGAGNAMYADGSAAAAPGAGGGMQAMPPQGSPCGAAGCEAGGGGGGGWGCGSDPL